MISLSTTRVLYENKHLFGQNLYQDWMLAMLKWMVFFCSCVSYACFSFTIFAMERIPRSKVTEVLSYEEVEAIAREGGILEEYQIVSSWYPRDGGNRGTRNLAAYNKKYYVNNIFPISGVCENFRGHECLQVCDVIYGNLPVEQRIAKKVELKKLTAREDYIAYDRTFDREEPKWKDFKNLMPNSILEGLRMECNAFIGDLNKYLSVFGSAGVPSISEDKVFPVTTMKCSIRQFYDYAHSERILWYDLTKGGTNDLSSKVNFVTYFQMCEGCEGWWDLNSGASAVCVLAIKPYGSEKIYSPTTRRNPNLCQFISSSPGGVSSSGGVAVSSYGRMSHSQLYAPGLSTKTSSSSLTLAVRSLFENLQSSKQSHSSGNSSSSSTLSSGLSPFQRLQIARATSRDRTSSSSSTSTSSSSPSLLQLPQKAGAANVRSLLPSGSFEKQGGKKEGFSLLSDGSKGKEREQHDSAAPSSSHTSHIPTIQEKEFCSTPDLESSRGAIQP